MTNNNVDYVDATYTAVDDPATSFDPSSFPNPDDFIQEAKGFTVNGITGKGDPLSHGITMKRSASGNGWNLTVPLRHPVDVPPDEQQTFTAFHYFPNEQVAEDGSTFSVEYRQNVVPKMEEKERNKYFMKVGLVASLFKFTGTPLNFTEAGLDALADKHVRFQTKPQFNDKTRLEVARYYAAPKNTNGVAA